MTVSLALLQHYRSNQKAIDAELSAIQPTSPSNTGLREMLGEYARYWRGAQHKLRASLEQLDAHDSALVWHSGFPLLVKLAHCESILPKAGVTYGLFHLPTFKDPRQRCDFIDRFIRDQFVERFGYLRDRTKVPQDISAEWTGTGDERTLRIKLYRGKLWKEHMLTCALPAETETLGEELYAAKLLWWNIRDWVEKLSAAPTAWPSHADFERAEAEKALTLVKSLVGQLSNSDLALLSKHRGLLDKALLDAFVKVARVSS